MGLFNLMTVSITNTEQGRIYARFVERGGGAGKNNKTRVLGML